MELYKASDLKKIFVNWSQGTLYNRIEKLGIKDNDTYIVKNNTTGNVLYNYNALILLKETYIKEFSINTKDDLDNFDIHINSIVSKVSNKVDSNNKETKSKDNKKTIDKLDNNDNNNNVNNVNISYINENYVSIALHNEITQALKKQIDFLEKQLEKATINNQELVDTIKTRERKDFVIEQQNLVKLQQATEIKEIGTKEDNSGGWIKKLFSGIFNKEHVKDI